MESVPQRAPKTMELMDVYAEFFTQYDVDVTSLSILTGSVDKGFDVRGGDDFLSERCGGK